MVSSDRLDIPIVDISIDISSNQSCSVLSCHHTSIIGPLPNWVLLGHPLDARGIFFGGAGCSLITARLSSRLQTQHII